MNRAINITTAGILGIDGQNQAFSMMSEQNQDINLLPDTEDTSLQEKLQGAKAAAKALATKRTTAKRSVTLILNKLRAGENLFPSFINTQLTAVRQKLLSIEDLDSQITLIYDEHEVFEGEADFQNEFLERQGEYQYATQLEVDNIQQSTASTAAASTSSENGAPTSAATSQSVTFEQLNHIMNGAGFRAKAHEVKLPIFHGSQEDVLLFGDFLRQFNDLIGDRSEYSGATKLVYLKSYLRGGALDLIKHLSNEASNYDIAIDFLKKEYMDQELVVDQHLTKLVHLKHPGERDIESMRSFFNIARSSIYELKNLGYNALEEDTVGNKILSYLLCEKLPLTFKTRLSQSTQTDYPSVAQLLENYNEVLKSLQKNLPKGTTKQYENKPAGNNSQTYHNGKPKGPSQPYRRNDNNYPSKGTRGHPQNPVRSASSLQAFQTQVSGQATGSQRMEPSKARTSQGKNYKPCKLCLESHSMLRCTKYASPVERIRRLKQMSLCEFCSGDHSSDTCEGLKNNLRFSCSSCNSHKHIAAVCLSLKPVTDTQNKLCTFTNSGSALEDNTQTILPSISAVMTPSNL